MKEKEPSQTYWSKDIFGAEIERNGGVVVVRFKIHQQKEKYWNSSNEIIPLSERRGERVYFHNRPYIPYGQGFMSEQPIGQAQAWYYPSSSTLVLWECFLHEWVRGENPLEDKLLSGVWDAWENFIGAECPGAERIATPSWEPVYPTEVWRKFLRDKGYRPFNQRAYVKKLK